MLSFTLKISFKLYLTNSKWYFWGINVAKVTPKWENFQRGCKITTLTRMQALLYFSEVGMSTWCLVQTAIWKYHFTVEIKQTSICKENVYIWSPNYKFVNFLKSSSANDIFLAFFLPQRFVALLLSLKREEENNLATLSRSLRRI